MTKNKKKRSSAASNASRTSKASAPKTAKKSAPARTNTCNSDTAKGAEKKGAEKKTPTLSAASGSSGSKPKATAKQQPKNSAPTKSAAQSSVGSKQQKTPNNMQIKVTAAPIGTAAPENLPEKKVNAWRDEPGTDQPLRVGRGVRTRDEYFKGQKGKNIHQEQHPDELYRRTVVLEIDDDENLLLVQIKRPTARHGEPVPFDKKNRRYIQDALTLDDNDNPIRLAKGKFELAPYSEDVREDQAKQMSEDTEKTTHENKRRFLLFRKKK